MAIRIHDTYTGRPRELIPLLPGCLKIYVCGPTVYDQPHLGHARSAVVYDVIRRYLTARGASVTYVRNVTDIDDKIIEKAGRQNLDYRMLGGHFLRQYQKAMDRLNVLRPDAEPKATDFILPIQESIAGLIQSGHAYRSGGNVYFSVESFKPYGRLSGRSVQSLSEKKTAPHQAGKKHPADFALWKSSKPWEPFWPSPWGTGRPGWHIECSVMSAGLLGQVFDIHGGGEDLIFPHHENEIAQSECISGKTPANYWIHHGLVQIKGEKMSKSLGNHLALEDLLDAYPAGALRLLMLSKRYRHPLEFTADSMRIAAKGFTRLDRFVSLRAAPAAPPAEAGKPPGSLWSQFCAAMDDDFNFPRALAVIFEGVRRMNRILGSASGYRDAQIPGGLEAVAAEIAFMCRQILGLDFTPACGASARLPRVGEIGLTV